LRSCHWMKYCTVCATRMLHGRARTADAEGGIDPGHTTSMLRSRHACPAAERSEFIALKALRTNLLEDRC
jgi:hypothetical protein